MMDSLFECFAQEASVFGLNTGNEDTVVVFEQTAGDFDDLLRRFARAENDFRKAFAQRAMRVHLSEPEVCDRSGLEILQNLLAADAASAELFQQSDGFRRCHGLRMQEKRVNPSAF
jgi:hypothetical protein